MSVETLDYRDVWVYLQRDGDSLSSDSKELIAAGRRVADKLKQEVVGVILGHELKGIAKEAIEFGADRVLAVDDPALGDYFSLRIIDTLHFLVKQRKPYSFLFLSTEQGKDLAPRLAYREKTGLATDNIQLEVDDYYSPGAKLTYKNLVIQIRPDFGTRVAKIYTPRNRPQMSTVRPGNFEPLPRDASRKGVIEKLDLPDRGKSYSAVVKEIRELPKPAINLKDAQVVISLGMGVLRDKNGKVRDPHDAYELALKLKKVIEERQGLRVEIGASRALIYAELKELQGCVGKDNQVGQTGTTVNAQVYIALGISGALQHKVGMQKSKKIVAVNLDPNAPIFQVAHYPIVEDVYDFLPEMIARMEGAERAA
ncbi:MAG: electron transfer flavoprotein subunit alpha/FixB family protein [Thaumarchaeota archaeon]|nr:electron transfer flavoprotein subunit alpha/FixB family protein [Nitrososphaerota archaeon]